MLKFSRKTKGNLHGRKKESIVTWDHTILQMEIVACYETKNIYMYSISWLTRPISAQVFKSVLTNARGDNNKKVKIHWRLLKTSYSLKPMCSFQPNLASSIFGSMLPFFKERHTSLIPGGDNSRTVKNFENFLKFYFSDTSGLI